VHKMQLNKQIDILKDQLKTLHKDKQALKQQRLQTQRRAARSTIRSKLKIINQQIKDCSKNLRETERNFRQDRKRISVFQRDCNTRHQFAKALPDFVKNNLDTHQPFFITLRFTNQRENINKDVYPKFIANLCQKLDDKLLLNTNQNPIASFFIATPEEHPMFHYHAFMMLPKISVEKFMTECVIDIVQKEVEALNNEEKDTFILKPSIIKAHSKKKQQYHETDMSGTKPSKIMIDDYEIYRLEEEFEYHAVSNYNMKSFINSRSLSYDDTLVECRDKD
jgi:hypothetical protein